MEAVSNLWRIYSKTFAKVVDESPASILLRDNTNAGTAKVAVWGSVEGASHSIFSDLLPRDLSTTSSADVKLGAVRWAWGPW